MKKNTNIKYISIDMNEIRASINEEIAKEMNEKGYVCSFSKETLKIKSIKPIKDNDKTNKVDVKFKKLKEDIKRRYNMNLSYTESYTLRCLNTIDLEPPKKNPNTNRKPRKKKAETQTVQQPTENVVVQNQQASNVEQNEQAA